MGLEGLVPLPPGEEGGGEPRHVPILGRSDKYPDVTIHGFLQMSD